MDGRHDGVGNRRDDRIGRKCRPRRIAPGIVQACKSKDRLVFEMNIERDLVAPLLQPLKKTVRRDKAAFGLQEIAEHRLFGKAFGPCVDGAVSGIDVLCPVREKPPLHHDRVGTLVHCDNRVRAARRDIEMRAEAERGIDYTESAAEVIYAPQGIPATHNRSFLCRGSSRLRQALWENRILDENKKLQV